MLLTWPQEAGDIGMLYHCAIERVHYRSRYSCDSITIVTIVSQYGDTYHNSNYRDSNVVYPGEVGRGQKGLTGEGILGRDPSSNNNQVLAFVGKCFRDL